MKAAFGLLVVFGVLSVRGASFRSSGMLSCSGELDGVILPVPLECSQFYICLNNEEVTLDCGADMHFDMKTKTCVEAHQSDCVPGQVQFVEKPRVPVIPQGVCAEGSVGAFIPSTLDCRDFFMCVGSEPLVRSCPNGMHFSPESRACIAKEISKCRIGSEEPEHEQELEDEHLGPHWLIAEKPTSEEVKEEESKTEDSKIEKPKPHPVLHDTHAQPVLSTIISKSVCYDQRNGAMMPVPGSCVKYLMCLQHKPIEHSCGSRHFDPSRRVCIDKELSSCIEEHVDGDLGVVIKTEKPTEKDVKHEHDQSEKIPLNHHDGNADVVSPDHHEHSDHFIVSGGKLIGINKTISIKKSGLPVIKKPIDSPVEVNDNDHALHTETEVSQLSRESVAEIEVSDKLEDTISSEPHNDNEKYYNVIEGVKLHIQDKIEEVEKEMKKEEQDDKDHQEVVVAVIDENEADTCKGKLSGSLFPRDGNCKEFLTCVGGDAFVGECPHGLHFNSKVKICDWPELAGCA